MLKDNNINKKKNSINVLYNILKLIYKNREYDSLRNKIINKILPYTFDNDISIRIDSSKLFKYCDISLSLPYMLDTLSKNKTNKNSIENILTIMIRDSNV